MKLVKSLSKILVVIALSVFVMALKSGGASAATFDVVAGTGCSLPEAMENIANQTQTNIDCPASTADDVINLPEDTITLSANLPEINTPLSVIGKGRGQSIIDGGGNANLFHLTYGSGDSNVNVEFRDFTARNIFRGSGSICISASSSSSITGTQSMTVSNLDLENCGQYSIYTGMYYGTTSISGVNLTSDLATDSIGIFSSYQLENTFSKISVNGYSIGVYFVSSGLMESGVHNLYNSTLTGNKIGLFFFTASAIRDLAVISKLYNNTIVGNTNDLTGYLGNFNTSGILFGAGEDDTLDVDMQNNIVAGNFRNSTLANCGTGTPGYQSLVTITSSKNLSDDTCGGRFGDNDFKSVSGVTSGLDVLADNGGGVKTMALLIGSAAINQGATIGTITTDARGITRPQSGIYDIGAYEKTADNVPDPDPVPEDPDNPGPPGSNPDPETPGVPRTGKLIGAFLASISLVVLLVLVSKEMIDGRIRVSKSSK